MLIFTIYHAKDGVRWRAQTKNGRIVADSGEAYAKVSNCRRAVHRLKAMMAEKLVPVHYNPHKPKGRK